MLVIIRFIIEKLFCQVFKTIRRDCLGGEKVNKYKFRVWNKKHQNMYYSDNFNCLSDFFGERGYQYHAVSDSKEKIIKMQYTGREDEKGKEIYEGDIVEFNNYENSEMYKGLVVFHDCSFCINLFEDYDYRYMREFHYIKILGNKYENPELLEVEE